MFVKVTSKRQVTFPARVLEALGVGPGDQIELEEGPDGFVLRPDASTVPASGRCAARSRPDVRRSISGSSGGSAMTRRFGIDTSVLVRLLTGDPQQDFE